MKSFFAICALAIASSILLSGCASDGSKESSPKGAKVGKARYIYLPPTTGSHLRRRVLVDENGQVIGSDPSATQSAEGGAILDLQRKSNARPSSRGGN